MNPIKKKINEDVEEEGDVEENEEEEEDVEGEE